MDKYYNSFMYHTKRLLYYRHRKGHNYVFDFDESEESLVALAHALNDMVLNNELDFDESDAIGVAWLAGTITTQTFMEL